MEDNKYYVYIYLDPRKPGSYVYLDYTFNFEPFYVGKGFGKRIHTHLYPENLNKNSLKNNKIKKIIKEFGDYPIYFKIKENIYEEDAISLEKKLIFIVGRLNINTGPLVNLTNGGEGTSGRYISKEFREKMRNRMLNTKASEETKRKISISHLGYVPSKETREKISKNSKKPITVLNSKKEIINRFDSIAETANYYNICIETIWHCLKKGRCTNKKIYFEYERKM